MTGDRRQGVFYNSLNTRKTTQWRSYSALVLGKSEICNLRFEKHPCWRALPIPYHFSEKGHLTHFRLLYHLYVWVF